MYFSRTLNNYLWRVTDLFQVTPSYEGTRSFVTERHCIKTELKHNPYEHIQIIENSDTYHIASSL